MSKKLYALDESDVVKIAKVAKGFELVSTRLGHFDDVRLNRGFAASLAPLDRDAAVERMTDAMIAASPDRNLITEDEREWYMRDARAALDALLQEDK